ncbi:MAG: hypothetical protein SNJ74_12725 [Fimbriimonadaceae bacterium]
MRPFFSRRARRLPIHRLSCRRFDHIVSESLDRPLLEREQIFLDRHRAVCATCAKLESQKRMALNMLRMAALDPGLEPAPPASFEERVIRRWRVESIRSGLTYWTPAIVGAAASIVAVLAAIQILAQSPQLPEFRRPEAGAKLERPVRNGSNRPVIPAFEPRSVPETR